MGKVRQFSKKVLCILLDKWFDILATGGTIGATYNRIVAGFPTMNKFYIWLICWAIGLTTYILLGFKAKLKTHKIDPDEFINKLTKKDILNALGGKYDEDTKIFLFDDSKHLLTSVSVENYYNGNLPKEFRKIRVNFLPAFVEDIKCRFFIGWNGAEGSQFKGAIFIEGEEHPKKIAVDDLTKNNIFEVNFRIVRDSYNQRYISFFIEPDSETHNKFWLQIRKYTQITLTIISFKV